MLAFIIRRVLWGIVTLVAVIFLTFLIFRIFPAADPAQLLAGKGATPQQVKYINKELGLDHSWIVQFWLYLKGIVLHFNFGTSFYTQRPRARHDFGGALSPTISLTVGAAILWVIFGIPVGIISAVKRGTFLDRAAMSTALTFVSMPSFWFAPDPDLPDRQVDRAGLDLPGSRAVMSVSRANPGKWFTSLILPWLVLSLTQAAVYSRLLRGNLLETMRMDFIRTARAKGLPERTVIFRHGVRAAITPMMTVLGLDLGALLGGAVITERIFEIHGVGLLNITAITQADFPVVQGTTVLAAMFVVLANIVVDVLYAYIDPRVRVQ